MHEDCGDWLSELSVVGPDGRGPVHGWRRAKFPLVWSWPGCLAVYLGGAQECGVRNGHQISVISVIVSYSVNKGREEGRVTKQAGRYLPLWNASLLGGKFYLHSVCQAL